MTGPERFDLLWKLGWMGWGKASPLQRSRMLHELGVGEKVDEINHCMPILRLVPKDSILKDNLPDDIAAFRELSPLGKERLLAKLKNGEINRKTNRAQIDVMNGRTSRH